MTGQNLVDNALIELGVIGAGESPSAEESAWCLVKANEMFQNWSLVKRLVYSRVGILFALTGGVQYYTLGPGGAINTTGAISTIVLNNPGTNYLVGNTVRINQGGSGADARIVVDTLSAPSPAPIATFHLSVAGTGYYPATGLTSTVVGGGGAGAGATFDITLVNYGRPLKIENAGTIIGGVRSPLRLVTPTEWGANKEKLRTCVSPDWLYNDNAYPLATLGLYPIQSGTPTLDLLMWQQLASIPLLTSTVDFPPGYMTAVRLNLAIELAAGFDVPQGKLVILLPQAQAALANIAVLNMANEQAVSEVQQAPQSTAPPAQ